MYTLIFALLPVVFVRAMEKPHQKLNNSAAMVSVSVAASQQVYCQNNVRQVSQAKKIRLRLARRSLLQLSSIAVTKVIAAQKGSIEQVQASLPKDLYEKYAKFSVPALAKVIVGERKSRRELKKLFPKEIYEPASILAAANGDPGAALLLLRLAS